MPPGGAGGGRAQRNARIDRQHQFLACIADGMTVAQACEKVGIAPNTYARWRERYPEFRAAAAEARGKPMPMARYDGSFGHFRKRFFDLDTYAVHHRIIEAIETCPPGGVTMILVPPEHGKTTLIEDYSCWRIANDPNMRITVVSEGQPHARKILRRIKGRMTDPNNSVNGNFISTFGPFWSAQAERQGKPWATDYFTVYRASHDERDYTMEARGWNSAIAGTRTDLLILDDIQSRRSLNRTDAMVETVRQDFLTRPGTEGRTIIIGTRVGPQDFYETMLEAEDGQVIDRVVILPAINADGEALCPELWPVPKLEQKKTKVGEETWARNYQQKPNPPGSETFNLALMQERRDISQGAYESALVRRCTMLDPALTGGCAIVSAGFSYERFEVVAARRQFNLGSVERICVFLEDEFVRWHPDHLIVEGNAFQKSLWYDERVKALCAQYGVIALEHTTGMNKVDEALGVARMPTTLVDGSLWFNYGDKAARAMTDDLQHELSRWRSDVPTRKLRQDLVMAMWFGWLYWQRIRKALAPGHAQGVQMKALPWAPTPNLLRVGS